jgi:signal transduction histidine kinase/ligand-binding sensor domain-containing protein
MLKPFSERGTLLIQFLINPCIFIAGNYIPFFFFLFILFYAPAVSSQTLSFYNWQVKNGLPQNSINNILQTSDGYLWIATSGGLARYDGVKFKVFNLNNTPGLKNNRIKSLFETAGGDLLIGVHEREMLVYRNNQFLNFTNDNDYLEYYFKPSAELTAEQKKQRAGALTFAQDKHNRIFLFVKERGLVIVDPVNYQKILGSEHLSDPSYNYLCSFNSEVYVEKDGKTYLVRDDFEYVCKNDTNSFLGRFTDWLKSENWGLKDGKLLEYENGKLIKSYVIPENIADNDPEIRVARYEDDVYISNTEGFITVKFNLKTKTFTTYRNDYNAEKGILIQIYIDKEGNIWYATIAAGVFKVKPQRFTYIDNDERIPGRNYYPIVKDYRGHIYAGSHGGKYVEIDASGNYIPIPPELKKELGSYYSYDLEVCDSALYIPLSTSNDIYKIKNNTLTRIPLPDTYKITGDIYRLYRNRKNELLIGGHNKILKLVRDSIVDLPVDNEIKFGNIVCFFEDSKDRLWVVSDHTIFLLDTNYTLLRSYKHAGDKIYYFRGIYEDKEGNIYVGSYGNGLTVIANDKLYAIDTENGLFENVISTISEDRDSNLWFTGNTGLTRVFKKEIIEITKGVRTKLNASIFNEETDVMLTSEFNGGNQHPKCHLGDDIYLFPSINGCVRVNFSDFKLNTVVIPVHIENVRSGDSTYAYNASFTFPYQEHGFEISYTALSFVAPENVKFKYMLEGYDRDWIDGGIDRKTFYNKLPPGDYIFKVIACNNDGIWNEEGASFQLKIIPPFYMTWWFRSIVILLFVGLTVLIITAIQKRSRRKELEKSALMDILPDLLLKLDRNGRCIDIYGNPKALMMPFEQLKGQSISDVLSKDLSDIIMIKMEEAFKVKALQFFDYNIKLTDGTLHHFEGRIIAKDNDEVLLIFRDITEKTQSQKKILENEKALLAAAENEKKLLETINLQQKQQLQTIINTEENERRRIANDLHDGVGQLLTSVKITLDVANERLINTIANEDLELIQTSNQTIDQITNEIRNISYNLSPPSLKKFGLKTAIEEELEKISLKSRYEISFYASVNTTNLCPKTEIILFRSFQELLNNAIKHSKSKELTVQLIERKGKLLLMVEDNGKGFVFQRSLDKKNASGLKNLLSRIESINGKINFDSSPNSGTSVIIEVSI